MKLLIIDTTKPQAILALYSDGSQDFRIISDTKRHSEALLFELEKFLCDHHIKISDIDVFGCNVGPGSFTGIRIGVATIKAFVYALDKKIVSSNYFEIVSEKIKDGYIVLKNTATSVYLSKITKGKVGDIKVVDNDNLMKVCGDNTVYFECPEHLEHFTSYKNCSVIEDFASVMLDHFVKKINGNKFTDSKNFAPLYAQLSQAERNLKDKDDN